MIAFDIHYQPQRVIIMQVTLRTLIRDADEYWLPAPQLLLAVK